MCDILLAYKLSDTFLMITEKIQFFESIADKEGKSKIYWQKLMLWGQREENETTLWKIVKAVLKLQSNFEQGFASSHIIPVTMSAYTQQVSEGIL